MKTNAPRAIAVIGSAALIAAGFGLGWYAALPDAISVLRGRDLASTVRTALSKPDELQRAADLAEILPGLDERNLDAVVGAYESTFTGLGPGAVAPELLAAAWAPIDPAGALQRMLGWRAYRRSTALPFLMRSWARRDLASARAALETIEPAELRESAASAVIAGWADTRDPAIWDAYVAGLPFARGAAYYLLQRIGANEGIDAMLRHAESVPEDAAEGFRNLALQYAVDIAARTDPERAAAFAEQHRASAGGLEGIVARRWGASDGPRAAEWALARPPGSLRNRAVRAAFGNWLWADEPSALGWVRSQPEEVVAGVRDLFAAAVAKTDPKRALEISEGIADPAERRRIQAQLARSWVAKQPAIAASWLEQNGLADLVPEGRRGPGSKAAPNPAIGQSGGGKVE